MSERLYYKFRKRIVNLKEDASECVRKSVGNALRDISKKFPELIV